MSNMEYHSGVLKEVFLNDGKLSIDDPDIKVEFNNFSEMEEYLWDTFDYSKTSKYHYVFANDRCFYWHEHEESDYDISLVKDTDDGYIIAVSFYNGGGNIDEVLDDMITRHEKHKK